MFPYLLCNSYYSLIRTPLYYQKRAEIKKMIELLSKINNITKKVGYIDILKQLKGKRLVHMI